MVSFCVPIYPNLPVFLCGGFGCFEPHISHSFAIIRLISSLRVWLVVVLIGPSLIVAHLCRDSGIPPKRAISGFIPFRGIITFRHLRGPFGVWILLLYF